jgi:hypothetical protein
MTDQSRSGGTEVENPGYVTEDLDESLVVSLAGTNLDGANNVAAYLSRFAHADSDKTDPRLMGALNVMCRKLSVQRLVRTSYDDDWRMAVDKSPLDARWWPLMLYLLLSIPGFEESRRDDLRGIALKRINAALVGIDVAKGLDVSESALSKLVQLAEQRLDALAG